MMLLTLVTVGICRGKRRAFWMSAVTGEFFTPLHSAPGYTNTSSNQLQTRVSSHYGQDDDASVYSTPSRSSRVQPIPLGFGMTSSMSRDAHMVYVDEHEMKPVSIISPRPRLFQTRFSVGSDEGEIANVPLDEEQSVKQDGEKAKPLV